MIQELKRTLVIDCLSKIGEQVIIKGWVQTVRKHGKITFVDVRDRTGIVQVAGFGKGAEKLGQLNLQDAVAILGKVKKREERYINKEIETGTIEIEEENVEVLAKAEEMPFDMGGKELNLELPTLLDYRSLTLRHPSVTPIFKVQAEVAKAFKEVAEKLNCIEIFPPTITPSATEGGADVFKIDYYDKKAYLAQSPQLYKQIMVGVLERVYTISHAYRAEPSVTTWHLSEVVQMDIEMGFMTFEKLLDALELVGTSIIKYPAEKCKKEMDFFGIEQPLIAAKVPRLKLREAQEIINKRTGRDLRWEMDLNREDEKEICAWAKEEYKSDFVTITHFPTKKKPFYTHPDPKDPEYSLSYDLLFRGVEISSGSQRINEYKMLIDMMKARNLSTKGFETYLQAFKYGMPPEGGFSFGLERITMKLLELKNIREAALFPRDMERVDERFSILDPKGKK